MEANNIYRKAIELLFHKTCGKMEHDEEKAIELFDKLLDRGVESHCDVVKGFCREAGYDEPASKEIAQIYDIIYLYKDHKESSIQYWDIDELLDN